MKKRMITLVLSVCLLLSLAPVNLTQQAYAADESTKVTTEDNLLTIDKVGKPVPGTSDEYEVELTVTAREEEAGDTVYTDVIVLMDATNSVESSGWTNVQQGVSGLLDTLLGEEKTKARVALVRFTDMQGRRSGAQETTFVTSGLSGTHFYTHDTLASAKSAVNNLAGGNNMNGWTNIQLPMIMAQRLLEQESGDNNKVVVLVTDGDPNAAVYLQDGTTSTVKYTVPEHTSGSHSTDRANYNFKLATGTDMKFVDPLNADLTVKSSSGNYERGGENSEGLTRYTYSILTFLNDTFVQWDCVDCSAGDVSASYSGSAMTIAQSTYIQSQMLQQIAEVYTVAVNVGQSTQKLIKSMATDADHAFDVASFAELGDTLSTISTEIKVAAEAIQVGDAMSEYVDLKFDSAQGLPSFTTNEQDYRDGNADIYISQGELAYTTPEDGKPTITWQVGKLNYGQTATMRYIVKLNEKATGDYVPLNDPTTLNYKIDGEPQKSVEFPVPEAKTVEYTVRHYQQDAIGSASYTEVTDDAEVKNGFAGSLTAAVAKTYTGYAAKEFSQVEITEDSQTVVEIYYDLQPAKYSVHHFKQESIGSASYNEVTDDEQELTGVIGWDTEAEANTYEGYQAKDFSQETVKADGSTEVNIYYDLQLAEYTVRHWKQRTAGATNHETDYDEVTADREKKSGVVGRDTEAESKSYEGYSAESFAQVPVNADGTTVVDIFYGLEIVNYTVKHWKQNTYGNTTFPDDYTKADEETLSGAPESTTAADAKEYEGYAAQSFDQTIIAPDGSTVVNILYNIDTAAYTVKHWKQKEIGKADPTKDYDEVTADEQSMTGVIGEKTEAKAKTYENYTAQTIDQQDIAGDGTTVVNVYYNIQTAGYTVRHWKQKASGNTDHATGYAEVTGDKQELTGAVGGETAAKSNTYTGYAAEDFSQETITADGKTVVNIYYNFDTANYKVEHYLENLADSNYTKAESTQAQPNPEEKSGTAGEDTKAESRDYPGFTLHGTVTQEIIDPEGTTVVKIYYKRNVYDYAVKYVVMKDGAPDEIARDKVVQDVKYGTEVSADPAEAKEIPGYTLKTNTEQELTIGADPKKNVIYFEYEENTATISYSAGTGGSVSYATEGVKAVTGTPVGTTPIPAPGYEFEGWYTDSEYKTPVTEDDATVDESTHKLTPKANSDGLYEDKTFYVKFKEKDVTISYVAVTSDGGSVSAASETIQAKTGTAKGSTATAKPGYSFKDWYTNSGCTTAVAAADGTVSGNKFTPAKGSDGVYETETFYALFAENKVTITYTTTTGGTVDKQSEEVAASTGTASGVTAIPDAGYEFDGWYSDADLKKPVTEADGTVDGAKFTPAKNEDGVYEQNTYYPKFKEILGSLTITKSGCEAVDANQSFIFHITSTTLTNTKHAAVSMTVTVKGNASVTIKNLPAGAYSVTEDANWSWRYTPDSASKDATVTKDGATVTFANTRAKKNWLTAADVVVNIKK